MYNSPFAWSSIPTVPYLNPYPQQIIPQPVAPQVQPVQQANTQIQQQNPVVTGTWNWKVTDSYQSMLMESVPFDGTPVLFMMKNESVFYVVSMVDGKKMINGFSFLPLGNPDSTNTEKVLTPEEQNEQRLANLEVGMANILEQLSKLTEVKDNESNSRSNEKAKSARQSNSQQQQ